MFDNNITAKLVYDYTAPVFVPQCMGTPRTDQMVGTQGEALSELSLRICYDSMGIQPDGTTKKSRSSVDAHKHILEVGHHSVYEHYNFTVQIAGNITKILPYLFNRPGIWVEFGHWIPDTITTVKPFGFADTIKPGTPCLRLTMNLRTVLDWNKWCRDMQQPAAAQWLGDAIKYYVQDLAPNVLGNGDNSAECNGILQQLGLHIRKVKPHYPQEKWVSLFISGSRGMSHELVRHGDRTAISQRSTRYCDESTSPWIVHPLVTLIKGPSFNDGQNSVVHAKLDYQDLVRDLEANLTKLGVDKLTARKQARGAARGYLGNALYTELIFSSTVGQWRHIINMRLSDAADAEIRLVAEACLQELLKSQYKDDFIDMKLVPASDGIGNVLVGGGHA